MEDNKGLLDSYLEEGKIPLTGEVFLRKAEVGKRLEKRREENRAAALRLKREHVVVRRTIPWYRGVAVLLILLLGVGGYYFSENKIVTGATAKNYKLPDGSHVRILENSSLAYNRISWLWERKLQLFGKAYFNVTSGKTFTVQTEAGDVTVLGTRFLVEQQGKKMFVDCEEGRVKVATPAGEQTLNSGESVHCDDSKIGPVRKKSEFPEILGYENDPLVNVVADIEHIFDVKVTGREKCDGLTYSGTILTKDLKETLNKVFGSSGISYQIRGKEIILE